MTPENAQLLSRLREGDPAARRELYDRQRARLYRYFLTKLPNPIDADDGVNEVFTRAWEGLAGGAELTESVDQWLWGIALNLVRERYRIRSREVVAEIDDSISVLEGGCEGDGAFDDDGKRQALKDAWEIIQTWTEPRRVLLVSLLQASHRKGYEVRGAELAAEMGADWPRERVDRELSRARAAIRRDMGILAVARAAAGCSTASSLVGQTDLRLRFTELPDAVRTALARHASVETASSRATGLMPRTGCKRCQIVFRDAQRPGLYVMGPGLMLLAAYAEPDQEQRRQALLSLWFSHRGGKLDVPASGTGSAVSFTTVASVTGPARLIQHVVQRVQIAAANVARLPAITSMSQIAQNNPGLMRAAAAVAVLVIGAGMLTASEPEPHPARPAAVPPAASAPQTIAITETPAPPPAPPPAEPPAEPSPAPDRSVSVVSDSNSGNESEVTDPSVAPSPLVEINLDATQLSAGTFSIRPGPAGLSARQPHKVPLAVGTHKFVTGNASFSFTVSAAGLIEYRPELRSYLDGAGTSTLVVKGVDITIDARQLVNPRFNLHLETDGLLTNQVHTLRLLPGGHAFTNTYGASFWFTVSAAGLIDYRPELRSYLEGASTSTLVVKGVDVTIDARQLANPRFNLHTEANGLLTNQVHTLRLVPGGHAFTNTYSASFSFTVSAAGLIEYRPELRSYLEGASTSTLVVKGVDVTIDARQLANPRFNLHTEANGLLTNQVHTLRLLPGGHAFTNTYSASFSFTVSAAGLIEYRPDLRSYLDGAGTSTLVVKGVDVTIDARQLANPRFNLHTEANGLLTNRLHTLRLLPGGHVFTNTYSSSFSFTVSAAGLIEYRPELRSYLEGAGTPTLIVKGVDVTIDARQLANPRFNLHLETDELPTNRVHTLRLLPGGHVFSTTGIVFSFTVTAAGTVDYDRTLTYLSGLGTSTLIVG